MARSFITGTHVQWLCFFNLIWRFKFFLFYFCSFLFQIIIFLAAFWALLWAYFLNVSFKFVNYSSDIYVALVYIVVRLFWIIYLLLHLVNWLACWLTCLKNFWLLCSYWNIFLIWFWGCYQSINKRLIWRLLTGIIWSFIDIIEIHLNLGYLIKGIIEWMRHIYLLSILTSWPTLRSPTTLTLLIVNIVFDYRFLLRSLNHL